MAVNKQSNIIFCQYFKKEMPKMTSPPLSGTLGQHLFENISQKAWSIWIIEQVKFINENKLTLNNPADRELIKQKMVQFFDINI